jgi:Cof subfamily protein (haloacid dehalogenase superfamily)
MKKGESIDQYKLVVSDIDGTIKCFTQPISAFTKKVIREIRHKGLLFTLATGRNLSTAGAFADELNVALPLVLSNGCIVQTLTGEVLFHAELPVEITKRVIEIADDLNMFLALSTGDRVYFKKNGNNDPIFTNNSESRHEIGDWSRDFHQISMVNKCVVNGRHCQEKIELLEAIYEREFSGKAEFYRSGVSLLEIGPRGISKAVGVEKLVEHLGLHMEQVIAFGDYDNDADLIAKVGLGIAVENATDKVKNNADLVIGSCGEDGPAKFLQELIGN